MIIEAQTTGATSAQQPLKADKEGALLVDQWLPQNYAATRAGRTFYLSAQAVTIAATHNTPIAAVTATPIVGFINPINSGVNAVITYGWLINTSGTPSAQSHPVWNYVANASTVTTNPSGTIVAGLLQSGVNSLMKPYNSVAITGAIIGTGTFGAVRPFGVEAFAAAQTGAIFNGSTDFVDGALVVPPGALIGIFTGTGAGTNHVVSAGMSWVEVPAN